MTTKKPAAPKKKQKYCLYVNDRPVDGGLDDTGNRYHGEWYAEVRADVYLGNSPTEGAKVAGFSANLDSTPYFCGAAQMGAMDLWLRNGRFRDGVFSRLAEGVRKSLEGLGSGNYIAYSISGANYNALLKKIGFKKTAHFISNGTRRPVIQWNYVPNRNQIQKKKPSSAKPRRPSSSAKRATR